MPRKRIQKITAWSFSRYGDYQKCPLMAKFKAIDKIKEPSNKYLKRGTAIHKEAELYQTRKIERGLCRQCQEPLSARSNWYCDHHLVVTNEQKRTYRARSRR